MVEMIPPARMIPDSVELIVGTSANTVSDLQTQYDGNIYEIVEENQTPGIDLRIKFINILRFTSLAFSAYYSGRATHYIEVQLFNYDSGEWETYSTLELSNGLGYQTIETQDVEEHIRNGEVLVRFCHPLTGNPADDAFIDYVALIR